MSTPDSSDPRSAAAASSAAPATVAKSGGSTNGAAASALSAAGGMTFVEMMFAVALGDTASQVAKVMKVVRESPDPVMDALAAVAPALAHLVLVIFVIATSWVGWYHSSATKRYMGDLKPVFAPTFPSLLAFPFIMLLIDVFLVVCYFILSEAAELPTYNAASKQIELAASAKPEIDWILSILVTYLLWNLVLLIHSSWYEGQLDWAGKRAARAVTAVASVALAGIAFWFGRGVTEHQAVLMIDVALLAAVLTFRLQGVDDSGHLRKWDVGRGLGLAVLAIGLILSAR